MVNRKFHHVLVLIIVVFFVIQGCAGRAAHPVKVVYSGDNKKTCNEIRHEIRKYKKNLKTLSLVFEDEDLNEEFYQDLIVDKYKTDHIKYLVTEELFLSKINDFFCSM